jgi:hypothetical protein
MAISRDLRQAAIESFSGTDKDRPPCPDCGGLHPRKCPRIKSERVVVDPEHTDSDRHPMIIERDVTYWEPGTWEKYVLVWPEDIFDDGEGSGADAGPDGDR